MKVISVLVFSVILLGCTLLGQSENKNSNKAYFCPPCNSKCDKLTFEKEGNCSHCGMGLVYQSISEREKEMESRNKTTIAFYLQNGVEVLDFAGPMEVFAYAGFDVFTVSKTTDPIVSQGILKVIPDYSIENAPKADILAFFGGNSGTASNDKEVITWIKNQRDHTKYHFSVCTGAFILGEAGILEGQTATTFYQAVERLKKQFPKTKVLADVRFVDNGKVITTAGVSAGIDGALHLVSKLINKDAAMKTAEYMQYDKWKPNEGLIINQSQKLTENK